MTDLYFARHKKGYMLHYEYLRKSFSAIAISFFLFLFSPFLSHSQTSTETDALFVLKGNTELVSGKSTEGVEIEVKKNGQTITKITSGNKGRYSLKFEVSILNKNNEYLVYISKAGTIPKTLSINTYISPEEYSLYSAPIYEMSMPIIMIETTEKTIILQRPTGRIVWDNTQHGFAFDQTFAKTALKEDEIKDDPDKLLKDAAEKKKKEDDELAKKKADDDARLKADEEAKRLADEKSKEEANNAIQKNLEAMKLDIKKKRMKDSLDSLASHTATIEIKKIIKPVSAADVDPNAFDGTGAYSINIAQKSLKAVQEKMNREKAANLSAKYETNNTLTSLLNMVDEYDKSEKSKVKSQKQ